MTPCPRSGAAVASLLAAVLVTLAPTRGALRAEDHPTPVLARVLTRPAVVVDSDGTWWLPYEIALENVTGVPITLESVDVLDAIREASDGAAVVTTLRGDALGGNVAQAGGVKSATLGAGQGAVLFVNARFAKRADVPAKLAHRIVAVTPEPKPPLPERTVEQTVAPTDVATAAPVVLGPALRGDRWVAAASCCDSYHRRAVLPINGARHLAQRYAIDWIRLTPTTAWRAATRRRTRATRSSAPRRSPPPTPRSCTCRMACPQARRKGNRRSA